MTAQQRHAARLARLLRAGAQRAGAWTSTEARVRIDGAVLDPAVAVVTGDLPCDGVTDDVPVLVVELSADRVGRWTNRVPTVWAPAGGATVTVVEQGVARAVSEDELLVLATHPTVTLPARQLLAEE